MKKVDEKEKEKQTIQRRLIATHIIVIHNVVYRYGFLLAGYRRERYYWEMIIMFHTSLHLI